MISEQKMAEMLENSYRNFHAKGFDYLCLRRTPGYTTKIYFADGDVRHMSEVVNPHDHRYSFNTDILSGRMSNSIYERHPKGEVYNLFDWHTPLLGGGGFKWRSEERLFEKERRFYNRGETYAMDFDQIHTIRMHQEGTVIVLHQYRDRYSPETPTSTFVVGNEPPDLSGLYEKFSPDQLLKRLEQYRELVRRNGGEPIL